MSHRKPSILAASFLAISSFALAPAGAVTRFDLNAPGSPTEPGWTAADLGNGSDGTVSITTVALDGGMGVSVDSRDRVDTAGDGGAPAMWNDFIFGLGSFANAPGSGLQITVTGLTPSIPHEFTLWAFDEASSAQADGLPRAADWSTSSPESGRLAFTSLPDPASLEDYRIQFNATPDAAGTVVLTGIVSATDPSTSHNVFLNGLEISDPLLDVDMDDMPDSFEQLIIDADPDDEFNIITDVLPEGDFDNDDSTNLEEYDRDTDPVDEDSDDDQLLDGHEDDGGVWVSVTETGTDPNNPDSDADTISDGVENHDLAYNPNNPTGQPGTDPNLLDTDGDTYDDPTELADGTDPTDPNDFLDPFDTAVARFDFNAPGSPTQADWTAAELGNGSNGSITVATEAIGGVTVDTRDRTDGNTDGPGADLGNTGLWQDFVFANGSFDSVPGSGLRITLSGLAASTTYPITIWAFDEESNLGRFADWGPAGEDPLATLTFPTSPDPASLDDYAITFEVSTDAAGVAVIEGVVAAATPSTSHNVFVNMLAVGQPTGSTAIRITAFSYDADTGNASITWTSSPGKAYALDYTADLASWPGDADDGIAAAEDAEETTYPFSTSGLGLGPRAYFRIREIVNN